MSKKFFRTDYMRHLRFGKKKKSIRTWRRARGKHSKIRRNRMGYPLQPTVGYGNPRATLGLIKGLKPVVVNNISELSKVNSTQGAVIAATVGAKKRVIMLKEAEARKIKILNLGGKK